MKRFNRNSKDEFSISTVSMRGVMDRI